MQLSHDRIISKRHFFIYYRTSISHNVCQCLSSKAITFNIFIMYVKYILYIYISFLSYIYMHISMFWTCLSNGKSWAIQTWSPQLSAVPCKKSGWLIVLASLPLFPSFNYLKVFGRCKKWTSSPLLPSLYSPPSPPGWLSFSPIADKYSRRRRAASQKLKLALQYGVQVCGKFFPRIHFVHWPKNIVCIEKIQIFLIYFFIKVNLYGNSTFIFEGNTYKCKYNMYFISCKERMMGTSNLFLPSELEYGSIIPWYWRLILV